MLPLFPLLAGPVIVECKDNDDALPKAAANISGAWSKVETKLTAQAAAGWPGLYAPWKDAQSYLYITSAVITDVVKRQELARGIERFFQGLHAKGQSKVQQVHVVDWSDVRDLLDRWPRLADAWLGVRLRKLRGHAEHVAALAADFRRYLLAENLPFVPPEVGAPAHPGRLFEQVVARAGKGGVLLTGAGGVGKTRTLLEVGDRAHAQGWRVLHALHGEPALKDQELFETVVQGGGKTLVLCDYVDQMTIDFGSVKRQLFSEVSQRGGSLAFLASARTARATLAGPGRAEFFVAADCYRLLDAGAWPDRPEGERALIKLGLPRPT